MLQSILSLDEELLIYARSLVGPAHSTLVQMFGEFIVGFGAIFLITLWIYGAIKKDNTYKLISLRIFFMIIGVFMLYSIINFGLPQWRPSPIEVAGGIKPLIPHPIDNSFPSGHALFSAALFVGIWKYFRKKYLLLMVVIIAITTTSARVIGGVHYPGDILGGFFFGTLGALLLTKIITSQLMENKVYPIFIKIAGWIKL